jgi:ribulose-phosphate 3-epimerase
VEELEKAGADLIHWDIMDGHYVPNLTFGPGIVKQLRPYSKLPFDVHLMVTNPDEMIPWFFSAGADIITVHAEVCPHLDRTLEVIRSCGAGVSLNPSTSEEALKYVLDKLDMVLVMTVNPGFGGQGFLDGQLEKIRRIKDMLGDRSIKIEVDGGINPMTAAECISVGADILVAGTSVFAGREFRKNIEALR